ncbi:MAG: leucine-rich repeat domain-containing protein, partial [Prevotella sp.]|nr:leucine-rich repeat domain-containing protein [Prevotella sp.]
MKQIKLTYLFVILMTLTFGQLHANDDNEVLVYYNGSQIHLYNVDGINYIIPSEVESSFSEDSNREVYVYGLSDNWGTAVHIPNSILIKPWTAFLEEDETTHELTENWHWEQWWCELSFKVTGICDYAFRDCCPESLFIPKSVTTISAKLFGEEYENYHSTSITVEEGNPKYDSRNNCKALIETETNTLLFGGRNSSIPEDIVTIGDCSFLGCNLLESIVIPNSVTKIGKEAFSGCVDLLSISIPENISEVGFYAFGQTSWYNNQPDGLVYVGKVAYLYKGTMPTNTSVTLRDGTLGISGYAFSGCSGLTMVTIPSSVTSIGRDAFSGCTGLTSVTIPSSVTNIDGFTFSGSGLTSVTIPSSVTSIGNYAFKSCYNLTSVIISEGVTNIGSSAFESCSKLTSVSIPSSVTNIGDYAFSGCNGLTSVKVGMETPLSIYSNTFTNRQNVTLYVPYGSKAAYEAADYWKEFKEIIELPKPVETTDISELGDAIYILPLSARIGGEVQMAICLKNAQTATAYNYELVLPDGVTVARNAQGSYNDVLSDRHDDHTRIFNNKGNNTYGFATLSGNSEPLTGNDGAIRLVTLAVDETAAEGVYPIIIQNATYSKPDGSIVTLPETTTTI